jgi:hypothetical protein
MARKPKASTSEAVAGLSRLEHLRVKLIALEDFLASPDATRNAMGFISATRLATNLRGEIEDITSPKDAAPESPAASMADHEIAAALVAAVAHLPDDVVDRIEEAIRVRRGGPVRAPRLVVAQ